MLKREWERFANRCIWSWQGWVYCWRNEPSLQFWFYINLASVSLAMVLNLSSAERALIIFAGFMLLASELMNTGVEKAVDRISLDNNPLAKAAKDTASCAVALTAIGALAVWIVVLVG